MFAFGTLIYLDRRGFAWCVPANLCASLVAGLLAAYGLHLWAGLPIPGIAQIAQIAQLVYLALIVGASLALGAPAHATETATVEACCRAGPPPRSRGSGQGVDENRVAGQVR